MESPVSRLFGIKVMNRITLAISFVLSFRLLATAADPLAAGFAHPPDSTRPWVYWYFMDGNLSREGLIADLEAMRDAGIGGAIFLEVDLGLPRGPVKFMSPEWRRLFAHAVHEAERLGIEIVLGSGPGWCGTGGPWVKPEQSMQHLVAGETNVVGPVKFDAVLPRPAAARAVLRRRNAHAGNQKTVARVLPRRRGAGVPEAAGQPPHC
jgi:hypothetical protein